jgi:hypothetical protein
VVDRTLHDQFRSRYSKANLFPFFQPAPKRLPHIRSAPVPVNKRQIPLNKFPCIFPRSRLENRPSIIQSSARHSVSSNRREESTKHALDEHQAVDVRVVSAIIVDQVVE